MGKVGPNRISDHEVSSHLKDRLFHGVKKHVRDSMRYLYSNPQTAYSELVVTARRAESETEETKVKARLAAATEVPSGLERVRGPNSKVAVTLLVPQAAHAQGSWKGMDRQEYFYPP